MATENILIKFTSDTSGLKDSVAELQKIGKLSEEDAKKFQMMEGFAEGVADALKEAGIDAKKFNEALGSSEKTTKSLRGELERAKNEAIRLSREFGATSVQATTAAKKAALLKAEISDMNKALDALNPTAKLNAFVNLGQGVQGAFQAATGALQVFGVENERITKLAQQFQGVLNLTQGINSVLQLKDVYTQLKLVLGVTTVAQEGLKAATIATTVAEEGAVVATNALNVSLKSLLVTAGPYLIILSILGVAINELNKSYEKEAKANKDSRDEIQRKRLVLIQLANDYLELANSSSKYLEIAKEEGKSELDLLQLQIDKNNKRKQYLKDASKAQQEANIDNELGKNIQNEINSAIEENTLLLLKLRNEIERVALQRLVAAQSQRDIEAAATKSLKAQFDSEYQGRLQVFDETLELSKIVNEIISKDASDRIKRDLVSEIDFLEKKLKETEETQKQDLANFEYYEKQKELIRAKLARTKKQLTGQEDKDDKEAEEKKEAIRQEIFENTQQLNSSLLGFTQALNEREIQGLEEKKKQGLISEEKYQQEIKKIQSRAAAAEKQSAIFSALIGIANGIINATNSKTVPVPVAVAIAAAIGAAQLATIIATPIPRFKEGTLNVGGGSLDSDGGMQAIIHRGEAIIPADRNREYHPTIKALYNRQVKASEINAFVQNKLSGKMNHNVNAKINTKELARAMSGSENVNIKNSNILAKQIGREIAGNINRRRS